MRNSIRIAVLAAVLAPASAMAADSSDSKTVKITGEVSQLCVLGEPTRTNVPLGQMAETSGSNVGRLKAIPTETVTLANSFCNFAHSAVTVKASALVADDTSTPPTGFSRAINYKVVASGWSAGGDATVTTADDRLGLAPAVQGSGADQATPKLSDIVLTFSDFVTPGNSLLISGGYSTDVTVTLSPSV